MTKQAEVLKKEHEMAVTEAKAWATMATLELELEKAYQALNAASKLSTDEDIVWAREKVLNLLRKLIGD